MASTGQVEEPKNFAPKNPPKLDPPKSDPITVEELAECNVRKASRTKSVDLCFLIGADESKPTLVAIKGTVFDVTGNASYAAKGPYRVFDAFECPVIRSFEGQMPSTSTIRHFNVFAGKDASRALAMSSVKPEDCRPDWEDLPDKEKTVLNEWMTFFSKRYNIVGKVVS
ncbi:hypothetical protein MMC34_004391 [Xylographa carneopallida]|nr:hypothetical protein [Xylographa carneopallida]